MGGKWVLGLDIGTGTIKAVVVEERRGHGVVRAVFREPAAGVKKGVIADVAELTAPLSKIVGEVRQVARRALGAVYVGVGTPLLKTHVSRGVVAVSRADNEIYQDDIDRVLKASQAINLAPNRMIVHNVVRDYVVDNVADITDPLGLSGNRLEVNGLVIEAFALHVKTLMRSVELAGMRIGGLVVNPLAAARAVLSKTQKDLGVVVVDVGAGTTAMSVYEEQKLVTVAVFPVGASNITNDIGIGLKIPVGSAEQVKLNYGYALARDIGVKEPIDLKKLSPENRGTASRRLVAEIIEARLAEILEFVNNELRLVGKASQLPGGVVLVGGGAKLPGITELARQELKLSSRIGASVPDHWFEDTEVFSEIFEDPEFAVALGLVRWGAEKEGWLVDQSASAFRRLLRYFTP